MNKELFQFLKTLKDNNNKEWFDVNRKTYESLKANFIIFVENLVKEIAKYDASISNVEAKKAIFRINRDIRFSKDKSPYKTNFGAFICSDGKKTAKAGYYIHMEPKQCFIAGGMWQPEPALLSKIRQEIDYNTSEFTKIVGNKKVIETFGGLEKTDTLKTMPKGYDPTLPHADFLKLKSFVMVQNFTDSEVFSKDFVKEIAKSYKLIYPFNTFLNRIFDDEN